MSEIMSERLKQLREEKGHTRGKKLTQEKAAEELFMSRTTLAKYENKDTDIDSMPVTTLMRLAKYYDCDPRYITGDISCKDKEVSDIHDATGLSESAIQTLISCKGFKDGMKRKGHTIELFDRETPRFISFLLESMNAYQLFRHIETGAYAKVLDKRYENRELDFEEMKQEIQREEMLKDMLNDEKWDDVDITLLSEQNLLFRKAYCENTASAIRSEVHRMLENLYDAYADLRIDEEYARLENGERMV